MSIFNRIILGEAPIIIFEGGPSERAYVARLVISRFNGAEILCEKPLIIRIPRSSSKRDVEEFISSLKGIGGASIRISINGEEIHRCLDNREKSRGASGSKQISPKPWKIGLPSMGLRISRDLGSVIMEKSGDLAKYMFSNTFVRIASMAIPSAISTIGRFINDANMMIIGTAISGGLFAFQSIGIKRARSKPASSHS
ncbi:MAG: hypothetical protein QXE01_09305 [Sulfolobales archaeon]